MNCGYLRLECGVGEEMRMEDKSLGDLAGGALVTFGVGGATIKLNTVFQNGERRM